MKTPNYDGAILKATLDSIFWGAFLACVVALIAGKYDFSAGTIPFQFGALGIKIILFGWNK